MNKCKGSTDYLSSRPPGVGPPDTAAGVVRSTRVPAV